MVRYRRAVVRKRLMLQPVMFSIQRDMARAANTMVRCASIDSRVWWKIGRGGQVGLGHPEGLLHLPTRADRTSEWHAHGLLRVSSRRCAPARNLRRLIDA